MSAQCRTRTLGFDIIQADMKAKTPRKSRFRCVECAAVLDINAASNGVISPDFQVLRAKQKGWKAHEYRKNDCYCPKCAGPQRKPAKEIQPMAEPAQKPLSIVPKAPTEAQREKIRELLELAFDVPSGRFTDGYSDQKIAEEVNVPRLIVEQIREIAFGPLKANPELAALRSGLAALKAQMAEHEKARVKLTNDLAALSLRVEKVV